MKNAKHFDDVFVLIEAESLSIKDEFMQHEPKTKREEDAKKLICDAIRSKVKNFYRPKYDPSFFLNGKGKVDICFKAGEYPALEMDFDWWVETAINYNRERNSRLGNRFEYAAFLGVLIKNLVLEGKTVEWAWHAVCDNSRELGNYHNSENFNPDEPTGSRYICGFYDLGNTYKILADEDEEDSFWLAGGYCFADGSEYPLADVTYHYNYIDGFYNSVGWIVCS